MPDLAAGTDRRPRNNYDVLRLIAASLVLVSHSFALLGHREPGVPWTGDTLGFDAVLIFFAISGMFISKSWIRDAHWGHYARKRALRLLPALAVCNLLVAFVVGPIVTHLSARAYLSSTGPERFVVGNTLMRSVIDLPGVFTSNPITTVNGSLNTLPVEVKAYVMVALIGSIVLAAKLWRKIAFTVALLLFGAVSFLTGVKSVRTMVVLFAVFAGGAAIGLIARRVPLRTELLVVAVGVWMVSYHLPFPLHVLLTAVSVPYVTVFLGQRWLGRANVLTRHGDFSYGMYIYAFPVQQVLISMLGRDIPAWTLIAVSLPITYALGAISWFAVEQRALRLKSGPLRHRHAPQPSAPRRVMAIQADGKRQ